MRHHMGNLTSKKPQLGLIVMKSDYLLKSIENRLGQSSTTLVGGIEQNTLHID